MNLPEHEGVFPLLLLLLLPLAPPRRSIFIPGLGLVFSFVVHHDKDQLPPPEVELGDAGPKRGIKEVFIKKTTARVAIIKER